MNTLRIATLIADLSRSVALLTIDVEHEEARIGVRDLPALATPAREVLWGQLPDFEPWAGQPQMPDWDREEVHRKSISAISCMS